MTLAFLHKLFLKEKPISFYTLFCSSSWATGLCEDLIKQNKGESRYSTRSMVLIKSATVTESIRTYAISNSDSKSNVLDHSTIGTPTFTKAWTALSNSCPKPKNYCKRAAFCSSRINKI
ncbi:hypothetical protein J6590_096620 [Homalodisca vitripennis]|nr:hypothetical protein J6590_078095 [Homalodisca vitripennis]KAG8324251.1 hypothetical protein J6590_096620 [Homalodisca vitripennis]